LSHLNLTVFAAKFFALGAFLTADLVWWRDALMGPPAKRRARLAVAVFGLLPLLITLFAIVFPA
jgi:hypothetical protein